MSNNISSNVNFIIGDQLQVNIRSRLDNQKAIVSVKGHDSMVKFEGTVPKEGVVTIEITGKSADGVITAKVTERNSIDDLGKKMGVEGSVEEAIRAFAAKGMPVSKENIALVREYLTNGQGNFEQRQKTLQTMLHKQIPLSAATIKSVHEALHGNTFSSLLEEIISTLKASSNLGGDKNFKVELAEVNHIAKELSNENELDDSTKNMIIRAFTEASKYGMEVDFASLTENIKQMIPQDSENVDQNQDGILIKNRFATNTPNQAMSDLAKVENNYINESLLVQKPESINVIVTEITKNLSQMTLDFKALKQDVTRNLENTLRILENRTPINQTNVKQVLESTIHKLDKAILKGDFLLYTDMVTEKKLLVASSQLADAKKLLAKGDVTEASKAVREVKGMVEKLLFKPSEVKMKHFISNKYSTEEHLLRQLGNTVEKVVKPFPNGEPSPRLMYEAINKIGLSNEREVGYSLISKTGTPANEQQAENLKSILLKMMKDETTKANQKQSIEQVVNSISGQQLLSKQTSTGEQSLFFQLPYMMDKQVEDIKIYVNSRNEEDKLDWENCTIYFVLHTKKLGDVGVLMSASEKNVSLTFKSNKDNLSEKIAEFTEITQERFGQIGYNLNHMKVKPLEQQNGSTVQEKALVKNQLENESKGYDITI
ncbi:hypothetical protein [Robertmurraya massiliosenegalensis]|uniref:hypothetical protein n=1 Tax=Robertmurraya massiliosenegalensis TaxID=1287657 RepID=UPI0011DCA779|nr:hypothetical protein [Robertmurraya massiliosenegalensis]